MATPIRVEKCKWDGRVSSSEPAYLVSAAPSVLAWFEPAGTARRRPEKGTTELLERDELWMAVEDEWWVLCASAHRNSVTDVVLHAAAPVEPAARGVMTWIDLDLDFVVHGSSISLRDEQVFHCHADTMAYPDNVIRGAWSGIARLAARFTTREWPFDGWLDQALARARLELGPHPRTAERLKRLGPWPTAVRARAR